MIRDTDSGNRTGEDRVRVCPSCDSNQVTHLSGDSFRRGDPDPESEDADWYCSECAARFDEPKIRESRSHNYTNDADLPSGVPERYRKMIRDKRADDSDDEI